MRAITIISIRTYRCLLVADLDLLLFKDLFLAFLLLSCLLFLARPMPFFRDSIFLTLAIGVEEQTSFMVAVHFFLLRFTKPPEPSLSSSVCIEMSSSLLAAPVSSQAVWTGLWRTPLVDGFDGEVSLHICILSCWSRWWVIGAFELSGHPSSIHLGLQSLCLALQSLCLARRSLFLRRLSATLWEAFSLIWRSLFASSPL